MIKILAVQIFSAVTLTPKVAFLVAPTASSFHLNRRSPLAAYMRMRNCIFNASISTRLWLKSWNSCSEGTPISVKTFSALRNTLAAKNMKT